MGTNGFKFLPAGDTALVVEFGDKIDERLSRRVLALYKRIEDAGIAGFVEAVPTLRSLIVHYDPVVTSHDNLKRVIEPLASDLPETSAAGRRWSIPACYDPNVAPDIENVARRTRLAAADVARLHSSVRYTVYMLGFLPGLPYMGALPEPLRLPRLESPRTVVPPGSVGIAMSMSVIYPLESPGGWHLIARTPVELFDTRRENPVLLSPSDTVTFRPVALAEFEQLKAAVAAGTWDIEPDGTSP